MVFVLIAGLAACASEPEAEFYEPEIEEVAKSPVPHVQDEENEEDIDTVLHFMEMFAVGDIAGMLQMMTEEMQAAGAEMYASLHQMTLLQRGSFIDWEIADSHMIDGSTAFDIAVTSVIGRSVNRVTVDSNGKVEGFLDMGFVFEPVPVDENATYYRFPVLIGEGTPWALDGLLTIPHEASEKSPVPALLLVHGSGAQNMDQSIFDNRVFHDIATYLSSNGIAVLRYDKRTLTHGAAFEEAFGGIGGNVTVWNEVIEDALLAAEILRNDPRISSVFVAGHSLGGMLSPRIAEEGGLDGAILLGASPRPLFEIQYDQNVQSINDALFAGEISQEEADGLLAMVSDMLEEAQNLPDLTDEEMQEMSAFGLPAIYQRSLMDSLPLPIILRNGIPTLILHGDKDFQVWTDSDFNVFVQHTQENVHVRTILYDGVTHIFTPAQTDFNDLREYMVAGHVDERVLWDIVDWINNHEEDAL